MTAAMTPDQELEWRRGALQTSNQFATRALERAEQAEDSLGYLRDLLLRTSDGPRLLEVQVRGTETRMTFLMVSTTWPSMLPLDYDIQPHPDYADMR